MTTKMSKYYFVDEPNKLYTLKQICKICDSLAKTEDKNNKGYKWIDFVNPISEAQISFDVSIEEVSDDSN
jgi:hypothetical protein|tara:strand:+ start:57 stop:266 length:210 start_codon:yes stop_codon:yes gene_type:complete